MKGGRSFINKAKSGARAAIARIRQAAAGTRIAKPRPPKRRKDEGDSVWRAPTKP